MKDLSQTLKQVLVAEDDPGMLRLWERVLTKEGFAVISATSGEEALEKLKDNPVSVVFTDINMPGMGGIELLKKLKQNPETTGICVNVLTGAGSIQGAVAGMQMGACDYIAKPFDIQELVMMTYRCLRHYTEHLETNRLKTTVSELQELARLKSEFVSNVSHELRTPLFSMNAALDLLLENIEEELSGPTLKLSQIIKSNYARLHQIVGNILDFSRVENGTLRPKFETVNLSNIAEKVMADLAPMFVQHKIEPHIDFDRSAPLNVEADVVQIQQIFLNLLGNSIKFTPGGGQVGIRLKDLGDRILASVWDTGKGIPAELLDRVFDRFYQVDGSSTREAGGAGIGLSIVKAIVEIHGGHIWVKSETSKGSEFFFEMPKKQSKEGSVV